MLTASEITLESSGIYHLSPLTGLPALKTGRSSIVKHPPRSPHCLLFTPDARWRRRGGGVAQWLTNELCRAARSAARRAAPARPPDDWHRQRPLVASPDDWLAPQNRSPDRMDRQISNTGSVDGSTRLGNALPKQ